MNDNSAIENSSNRRPVFLVDDHPILRQGLAQVLNAQPDLRVCGEAATAEEAVSRIEASHPHLVMVDLSLEGKGGLELIKDLHSLHPEMPLLVLSMHDESIYAERTLRAGARGYVMKRAGIETVLVAIRQILRGERYLSEDMANRLLNRLATSRFERKLPPIEMLTDREFEVYQLLGEGCTTRVIAERLHLSPKTVDVYRQNLRGKFSLPDALSLVQHAVRWVETKDANCASRPAKN